jgi:RNA polymerase sigma-70 factor (ECF subfamily)
MSNRVRQRCNASRYISDSVPPLEDNRRAKLIQFSHKDRADLILRIRAGDESAMGEIYDCYAGVVYGTAVRVLGSAVEAEDLLQEIFIQLWRNPHSFNPKRGRLAPWLAVITRNRAIDLIRRRPLEEDIDKIPIANTENLEGVAAERVVAERIYGMLKYLPLEQRKALEMAFFENMTHTEIAGKTGKPLGTVKTYIRSALATLREYLRLKGIKSY